MRTVISPASPALTRLTSCCLPASHNRCVPSATAAVRWCSRRGRWGTAWAPRSGPWRTRFAGGRGGRGAVVIVEVYVACLGVHCCSSSS